MTSRVGPYTDEELSQKRERLQTRYLQWGTATAETMLTPAPRRGIVILGKARGRRKRSLQLLARTAVAGLLWHLHPAPKPMILVVSRDAPDPRPDSLQARDFLIDEMNIPAESILARTWSNCTIVEARGVRVLARAHRIVGFDVITHPYHATRVKELFSEVLEDSRIFAVSPDQVRMLTGEDSFLPMRRRVEADVTQSMPRGFDLLRERCIEKALLALHKVDPRGRIERVGAHAVRPAATPGTKDRA